MDSPTRDRLCTVRPEWVDSNQHMNLAYYLLAGDYATDTLWPRLQLGRPLRALGLGTFAAESWVNYRRELLLDMPIDGSSEVLGFDSKRLLLRHRLFNADEGWAAAEIELLFLCVDLTRRKVTTWPPATLAAFAAAPSGPPAERLSLLRR